MFKNLTPEHLRCPAGYCPAVYEMEDGTLAIIGSKANTDVTTKLSDKVAPHEDIVTIRPEFLASIIKQVKESD